MLKISNYLCLKYFSKNLFRLLIVIIQSKNFNLIFKLFTKSHLYFLKKAKEQ